MYEQLHNIREKTELLSYLFLSVPMRSKVVYIWGFVF